MSGKGRGGRGKSKSSQAVPKTSKSAKKKKQNSKVGQQQAKPKKDLIAAAITTLTNNEYAPQIRVAGFVWSETLIQEIKTEYESMNNTTITSTEMKLLTDSSDRRNRSWREKRMRAARDKVDIGLVEESKSSQATSKASKSGKTSKSTEKEKQKSKKGQEQTAPKKDLIAAAITILTNNEYVPQIRVAGFVWSETLIQEIKDEYESMPHGKSITADDDALLRDVKGWQNRRMSVARGKAGIGKVYNGHGGKVGEMSARVKNSNKSILNARQNTTDEKGPLQTVDLPVAELESIIELGEDLSRNTTTEVSQDLIEYFPIGNDEAATAGAIEDFEGVMSITKAVFLIEEMNLTGAELDGMDHPEIDERVDKFMAENFSYLDKESKEYEEEAGVRKFTLHFVKCRMTSVKEALKKGDAFLIPVKIEVDGKIIRFKAVFTVVSERV